MSLTRRLAFALPFCLLLAALTQLPLPDARAAVSQPSGESMPQQPNKAELDVVCSRGFPDGRTVAQRMGSCGGLPASTPEQSADSLLGLFTYNQEGGMLDPTRDAYTTPGTFSPQCGLTGTIVLRGGVCTNALAWYNAVENPTAPPAMNELYTLVPGDLRLPPPMGLGCDDNDFCPLATRMHNQAPTQHRWADPLPTFAGNIRTDPRWRGGLIGFALVPPRDASGNPMGQCPQIHYSQKELNPKSTAAGTAGMPWIVTLVYQSKIDPGAYYLAFEDQPACPGSWQGGNCGGVGTNDGDFNDFVFYVKGLSCKGGGQPCTIAGAKGICAQGATQCAAGGTTTTCVPVVQPSPEKCDGVDNDCNDVVDEGDGLCAANEVCAQGRCRHICDEGEFPCAVGLVCDTDGLCKDRGCIGKTCAAGQVCQLGTCVGGCDGVMCPPGQVCRLGNCVSPCEGITCPTDRPVCEGGACQPLCSDKCRSCDTGFTCDTRAGSPTLGSCLVTGCENKTCPAGQVCVAGNCQDGCQGVVCPGGQECMMGRCMQMAMPDAGVPAGSGGGGGFILTGRGGASGSVGAGGAGGVTTSGSAGNGSAGTTPPRPPIQTCSCEAADGPGLGAGALLLGVAAVLVGRRRATARARRK